MARFNSEKLPENRALVMFTLLRAPGVIDTLHDHYAL